MVWVCMSISLPENEGPTVALLYIASLQGQRSKSDSEYNKGPVLQVPLLEAVPMVLRPQQSTLGLVFWHYPRTALLPQSFGLGSTKTIPLL